MIKKLLVLALAFSLVPPLAGDQEPSPIIDMHLHAGIVGGDRSLGLCVPWVSQFPPWDPDRLWEQVWFETMTKPPCRDPIWSPTGPDALMKQTIAVLERRNIIGVLTGNRDEVLRWNHAAPGRFLPSVQFKFGRDDISPQAMRRLFGRGEFVAFIGLPGLSEYRVRLGNPLLLEEVLIRYPRLRVSVMHYGSPFIDEMIAVMQSYPQVYVDLGGRQWYYPRPYFYAHLRKLIDAGLGKRVMFGSDQGDWAGVIEPAIQIIQEAPFLSEHQKRDIFYNNAARFLKLSEQEIARHHGR